MKRILSFALAVLMCLSVMTGCSSKNDDWSYIKNKGNLVIGITEWEPMNYYDKDGTLVGFDTEFAQALCKKLGLEAKFVIVDWDSKELELQSKNIDCIWNGLTVTEARKADMSFAQSYMVNRQVVVIRSADAAKYKDVASLSGVNMVAEASSAGESAIQTNIPKAKYTAVNGQSDALLEVKAGTADAAVIDLTMANSMVGAGTDYSDLMIVDCIEQADEQYAIGLRLDSSAVEKFNKAINELIEDGTLNTIAEKYGLTDQLIVG